MAAGCILLLLLGVELVYSRSIRVTTRKNRQILDVTPEIQRVVAESGIEDGLALVFTKHTTTGLFINEKEGGLIQDVESVLSKLVPADDGYLHDRVDDNAASHIQALMLSPSVVVPVEGGSLAVGTWQSVLLAERDGPRTRTVIIKVVGDKA
jgi:secondary thiamine-phosphate synthase enzyme